MPNDESSVSRRGFMETAAAVAGGVASLAHQPLAAQNTTAAIASTPEGDAMPSEVAVRLRVNGREQPLRIDTRTTLLDALREKLQLTGTKKGCDHGQCGACTVLVNGRRVYSCLTLAVTQEGREITTIEGVATGDQLHPVQEAFIEHDAFQCGYCTSGQICSAIGLLSEGRAQSDEEVRELMSGNLCRCGAYTNIVAAIQDARSK